jgi:ribosome-binding factor A
MTSHGRRPAQTAGPSQRQLKVAEEIRHLLAEILLRIEFRDPELAGVHLTISEVRVTPDLKHAQVYLTRLGNGDIDSLLPALKRASAFLRSQIAPRMATKTIPALHFLADHAIDEAMHIDALLKAPGVARDLK